MFLLTKKCLANFLTDNNNDTTNYNNYSDNNDDNNNDYFNQSCLSQLLIWFSI